MPLEDRTVLSVEEQLKVITSGTMQIVPMEELKAKLAKGVPLNICARCASSRTSAIA